MTALYLIVPLLLIAFFLVLAAWIWVVWPRTDPTDDELYERRHMAHKP